MIVLTILLCLVEMLLLFLVVSKVFAISFLATCFISVDKTRFSICLYAVSLICVLAILTLLFKMVTKSAIPMACPIYLEALTIPDPIPVLLTGKYFTDDVNAIAINPSPKPIITLQQTMML